MPDTSQFGLDAWKCAPRYRRSAEPNRLRACTRVLMVHITPVTLVCGRHTVDREWNVIVEQQSSKEILNSCLRRVP